MDQGEVGFLAFTTITLDPFTVAVVFLSALSLCPPAADALVCSLCLYETLVFSSALMWAVIRPTAPALRPSFSAVAFFLFLYHDRPVVCDLCSLPAKAPASSPAIADRDYVELTSPSSAWNSSELSTAAVVSLA